MWFVATNSDTLDGVRATTFTVRESYRYAKFPTLLQLTRTRTRSGLLLESHPALWVVAGNAPPGVWKLEILLSSCIAIHLALLHFFSRVFSFLLHLFTMEAKRGTKHFHSSTTGSSSSPSNTSTPPPSPSGSPLPPTSPSVVSSRSPPSPVYEHGGPSEGTPVVDLSSKEEDTFSDTSRDEEPPGDANIIILSDSNEE
jgi:hypothetical protein